jgi:apoptotic chromatin condensation inducer in the nucleus
MTQYENSDEASSAYKNIDSIVFPPDTGRTLHVGSITESKAEEMIVLEQEAAEKRIKFDWELAIKELPSTIPSRPVEDAAPAEPSVSPSARRSKLGGIEQVAKQLSKAAAESGRVTSEAITPPTEGLTTSSLRARTVKVLSLDELFKKTKTLPALYYQPVSEDMAQKRLETMRGSH